MDPLTISTAVLACAKIALSVSISLGDFIRDATNVDENTRSLEQEIVHLSHDCRLVAQELTRLPAGVCAGGGDPLFTRIKSRISACTESLQKLDLAIKSLRPNRSNIVAKGYRQLKLNFKEGEIREYRDQVQRHSANLQLCLQLVNLRATYLLPQKFDPELISSIKQLRTTVNTHIDKFDTFMVQQAEAGIDAASTLCEKSLDGSQYGTIVPDEFAPHVESWLSDLKEIRLSDISQISSEIPAATETNSTSTTSASDPIRLAGTKRVPRALNTYEGDGNESDLETDVVRKANELGDEAFHASDYQRAELMYEGALKNFSQLFRRQQAVIDMSSTRFRLAICAFYLHDTTKAEAMLAFYITEGSSLAERCKAGHLLAVLQARQGNLERALETCTDAVKDKRRHFGKSTASYHQSIALLSRLHRSLGNDLLAEIYEAMIPRLERGEIFAGLESYESRDDSGLSVSGNQKNQNGGTMSTKGAPHGTGGEDLQTSECLKLARPTFITADIIPWRSDRNATHAAFVQRNQPYPVLYDSRDGSWLTIWQFPEDAIPAGSASSIALSPNSEFVATGHLGGLIVIWSIDTKSAHKILVTSHLHKSGWISLAFSPFTNFLAVASSNDKDILLYDANDDGRLIKRFTLPNHYRESGGIKALTYLYYYYQKKRSESIACHARPPCEGTLLLNPYTGQWKPINLPPLKQEPDLKFWPSRPIPNSDRTVHLASYTSKVTSKTKWSISVQSEKDFKFLRQYEWSKWGPPHLLAFDAGTHLVHLAANWDYRLILVDLETGLDKVLYVSKTKIDHFSLTANDTRIMIFLASGIIDIYDLRLDSWKQEVKSHET